MKELTAYPGLTAQADELLVALDAFHIPEVLSTSESDRKFKLRDAWRHLRREVHTLCCTNDERYKDEREQLRGTARPAVALMTALLIKNFGFEAGTAGSLAALALLMPIRLGVGAWCSAYAEAEKARVSSSAQVPQFIRTEARALTEIADYPGRLPLADPVAIEVLSVAGYQPDFVVPQLVALLQHPDRNVKYSAFTGLERYGPLAMSAGPAALEALDSPDSLVRYGACRLLQRLPDLATRSIPALTRLLEREQELSTRSTLAEALVALGPMAATAGPLVREIAREERERQNVHEIKYGWTKMWVESLEAAACALEACSGATPIQSSGEPQPDETVGADARHKGGATT